MMEANKSATTLDFDRLLLLLSNPLYTDLNNWTEVPSFELLGTTKKNHCEFANKPGVYVILDKDGNVVYLGKAKCLYDRLSSHSRALNGGDKDKAPAWDQFFTFFKGKGLVARYLELKQFSDEGAEYARQSIERALQLKYRPYFDEIYGKKKIVVENLDATINALMHKVNVG